MKKKMKHTHRHTKMKILAEKIVKKIRSSISRPHRTQFPLVHINIHTHNRHVSPRSHLPIWLSHAHTHTPTLVPPRAYGCCHGNLLCCEANGEERVTRAATAAAAYYNWESASPRSTPVEPTHSHPAHHPSSSYSHTHNSHDHTHTHTSSLTYASCAFSEQLIVIEEKSRVRVSF